jgi:uncharacterized membrane protein YraQ (UPF0718 family)
MLAAPIVNPITIWSTWHAFSDQDQWWVVISRIGMGYGVAVLVGIILLAIPMEKVLRDSILKTLRSRADIEKKDKAKAEAKAKEEHEHHHHEEGCCGHDHNHDHSHDHGGSRVVLAIRSGVQDCVDVAVYFSIGVCLTAMFNIWYVLNQEVTTQYLNSVWLETGGMMVLAFVLSVCSTSDAFMAATLRGVGIGSKMAFMVLGPMMDVKLLFLYQTVMRKKFLFYFAIGLFVLIGILSVSWQEFEPFRGFFSSLEGGKR